MGVGWTQEERWIREHHFCFTPGEPAQAPLLSKKLYVILQEVTLALVTSTATLSSQADQPIRDLRILECPAPNPESGTDRCLILVLALPWTPSFSSVWPCVSLEQVSPGQKGQL